jgi:GAF domain-containing protein
VSALRELFELSGCAFLVVDWERRHISPAAAWFASDAVRNTFGAVLDRPYEPERAGITEAAIESGSPLLLTDIGAWAGADALRRRLHDQLPPDEAQMMWDWYRSSSLLACPVQAPDGRMLGVLALAAEGFDEDELRSAEVFAHLAAVALDRAELLAREEHRTQIEQQQNRAAQEVGRSLELEDVYRAAVVQAVALSGAPMAILSRQEPASRDLRVVASVGAPERIRKARFVVGEGMIGEVATSGRPYASRPADRERFLPWIVDEGVRSFAHVPLSLGPRLFGVLTVAWFGRDRCDDDVLDRLTAFGRAAAGAIANALDFQRERRVARALTSGFVPGPLTQLEGFDAGLVYEPSGQAAGGGDFFGIWRRPDDSVAVLVGDVSGKGIEVAAISAMVRFFIEARTFDTDDPAAVMAQTASLLRRRLPGTTFVPAVMAVIGGDRIRWCNAGHPPPLLMAAGGGDRELRGGGLPLGVDDGARYETAEAPFGPGDVVFAATDGLTEARRDGVQFGDARLAAVLAEHGRGLAPDALVRHVHDEAQAWSPALDDDIVVLALRRRA